MPVDKDWCGSAILPKLASHMLTEIMACGSGNEHPFPHELPAKYRNNKRSAKRLPVHVGKDRLPY